MDIAIIETLNGGDAQIEGNDLALVYSIENMPYLSMFGGNPGYITKTKPDEEQSFDFWGNNLLMANNPSIQFNSYTEDKLRKVALNSSGRAQIEDAVKKDLDFMKSLGKVSVGVSIVSDDRISIEIRIAMNTGGTRVRVVNFRKKSDGDFYFEDFNDDFLV